MDHSLPLSEIADEITAIELETTDESLINPGELVRIIITENYIITVEFSLAGFSQVLVFNRDGKFIRSVGARGQGPGEFNIIINAAFDDKNNRLFIFSWPPSKIIRYQLDGKFLEESRLDSSWIIWDLNYINNELFIHCKFDADKTKTALYRLNDDFMVADSGIINERYYSSEYNSLNFIVKNNTSVYYYSPEVYPKWLAPEEKVLRDTLYRLADNQLVPELKLKFGNDGFDKSGDKIVDLYNIYRSSRYVFVLYRKNPNNTQSNLEIRKMYNFCYDTKTGKGYNMQDGFTDDINGIEKRVSIHPLHTDSEIFYYWYTHIKPDDSEEPNPTLYIIKLKK